MSPETIDLEEITIPPCRLELSFPEASGLDQDEEWVEVRGPGGTRRLRLHDYSAIYSTPGLYEALVYRALGCRSPAEVLNPLAAALAESGFDPADLRVLDLGAGNGIVGELLRQLGVGRLGGVDILPEAAEAARRDRAGVYDDYLVADLAVPGPETERFLGELAPNCLVTVAALGFGDIPPAAFTTAFGAVAPGGWVAMCIRDKFLDEGDDSGFGRLLRGLVADGRMVLVHRHAYVHRVSIAGEELEYVALVARKA